MTSQVIAMRARTGLLVVCALLLLAECAGAGTGNRLAYLDSPLDPYYVGRDFPRITTPQWVGDDSTDAVVVLAIDDMRAPAPYEQFLRPILNRLREIDGRAPVSIMTCTVDPADPQLQSWLEEGLSIEVHTVDHPCPLLHDGDFAAAKSTYDRCIDLLAQISGNLPVAFRMPCCDSLNTPSPRFWTEVFNQTTEGGRFLQIDSSVFNITTSLDPSLPADLATDADGKQRFRKYLPFPSFVNTIEDYPYPYVIGRLCWEFPCVVPSDWEAQNLHQPNNPRTVEDLQRALDAVVAKQGVFDLVFHPHGWIRSEQVSQLIEYAVSRYGTRVKFLTFREAIDKINAQLLGGQPLRDEAGRDNGVYVLDADNDGYQDVISSRGGQLRTRVWQPTARQWLEWIQPASAGELHFGVADQGATLMLQVGQDKLDWRRWDVGERRWRQVDFAIDIARAPQWRERLARPAELEAILLRDLDDDGACELLLEQNRQQLICSLDSAAKMWRPLPFSLPADVSLSTAQRETGLRLVDVDGDSRLDCLFSDARRCSLHVFQSMQAGWGTAVLSAHRSAGGDQMLPAIMRADGTNNGAWLHSGRLWVQNEDTSRLPDHVDRADLQQMCRDADQHAAESPFPPARTADQALDMFQTSEDLEVELVAAEPLVVDPIAFDWGPDGRLWVVEMGDYPNGVDGAGKPGGRVKVLEDDDGDGRYDRASVFLDQLPFPTGIKVWRDGVLVCVAPDLIYAEDANRDGVADVRRTLYSGFGEGNQQHRVNGLCWGLDNWLYLANGDSGGTVRSWNGKESTNIRGRDLRIRPDTGDLQAIAGQSQYGRCSDNQGNWFGGNNSSPVWHFVLDDHYLQRNSHLAVPVLRHEIAIQPGAAPVFPASPLLPRFNDFDRANRFTSACSPIIYRDELIGDPGQVYTYVCEPVHNLVHREIVEPDGVTFTSHRLATEQQSEFLASRDNWFRPVMVRTGPDGALWVADMYRLVIEHPEWIPQQWQQRVNLRDGDDRGRMYRVRRRDVALRTMPRLVGRTTAELVELLDHPNGWQRDMVHQLLIWRGDRDCIKPLRHLAAHADVPWASLHALYLLDALGGLTSDVVLTAMQDDRPAVVRHALKLSEPFVDSDARIGPNWMALLGRADLDAQVSLQLGYSLGQWHDRRAAEGLAELIRRHGDDVYVRAGVMSSLQAGNLSDVLTCLAKLPPEQRQSQAVGQVLAMAVELGNRDSVQSAFAVVTDNPDPTMIWQLSALNDMLAALDRRGSKLANLAPVQWNEVRELARSHAEIARNQDAEIGLRVATIRLVAKVFAGQTDMTDNLSDLLSPQTPPAVQQAAVDTIVEVSGSHGAEVLLARWDQFTPESRQHVLDVLLSRTDLARALLNSLQNESIGVEQINATRRQQLLNHADDKIRVAAEAVFETAGASSRTAVLQAYEEASQSGGDVARGKLAFSKHCSTCHRLEGVGHDVGPDLAALTDKSPRALLVAMLDPNRSVEDRFLSYTIVDTRGRQVAGILSSETANTVTLLAEDGKRTTLLRNQIDEFRATGKSLMPEGLEQDVKAAVAADIVAYVRSHKLPPKSFFGNVPQLAPVRDDGSIRLLAMHAQIYGPSLVFEQNYRNLGLWESEADHAIWQLQAPHPGPYQVTIDYACEDATAGNRFVIIVGDQQLSGVVRGTGSWNQYASRTVGEFDLTAEPTQLVLRSTGPLNGFLMDLRTIILRPR